MRNFLFTLLLVFSILSCEKNETCHEPKMKCDNIRCFAFLSHFDFKIVDKTNGNDLVFGTNPRYQIADIKLYFDAARTLPIPLTIDNTGMKFKTMFSKEEMYLEVKGTDVYKLTAEYREVDCCSNRVKTLLVDGLMVCSCCTDAVPVPVN